jgi:predicted anti-sigma-YlaC factor YlaD
LDAPLIEQIEAHFQHCSNCQEALNTANQAWDILNILPKPETAPYLYTRIKKGIVSTTKYSAFRWMRHVLVPVTTAAAVALGIFLGSMPSLNGNATTVEKEWASSEYVDQFEDFSNASLGEAYAELTGLESEMEDFQP